MMWLITVWVISITFNTIMIVRSMKKDRKRVTSLYLFYYFTIGSIIAPLLAAVISIGVAIEIHHKLRKVNILNKTVYRFGGKKSE